MIKKIFSALVQAILFAFIVFLVMIPVLIIGLFFIAAVLSAGSESASNADEITNVIWRTILVFAGLLLFAVPMRVGVGAFKEAMKLPYSKIWKFDKKESPKQLNEDELVYAPFSTAWFPGEEDLPPMTRAELAKFKKKIDACNFDP